MDLRDVVKYLVYLTGLAAIFANTFYFFVNLKYFIKVGTPEEKKNELPSLLINIAVYVAAFAAILIAKKFLDAN